MKCNVSESGQSHAACDCRNSETDVFCRYCANASTGIVPLLLDVGHQPAGDDGAGPGHE